MLAKLISKRYYLFASMRRSNRSKTIIAGLILLLIIWEAGLDLMIRETPYSKFSYPLTVPNSDFIKVVTNFREERPSSISPTNLFYSSITFTESASDITECSNSHYFLVLVKSAPKNFENRDAIRQTWKNPSLGIASRTVFFIGNTANVIHTAALLQEQKQYQDIVRIQYDDTYFNNTIKTVVEMRYAAEFCSNFKYAILIDDDYYLSITNLHEFTQEHSDTDKLYAGFTFFSKPLRHRFRNKWFIDLEEYPFAYFPRFVNAGNILLSKAALLDIYYATFFVKPFRFDDVYVAICAKKMGIEPVHSDRFKFWVESGDQPRQGLVAAHGYDPDRLRMYWQIQKQAGYT